MPWLVEYLFHKYRDYTLDDQSKYDIKRKYNLSSDNYAILCNKIRDYQVNKYGDILYNTSYEFYNKEELDKIRVKAINYRRTRLNRKARD